MLGNPAIGTIRKLARASGWCAFALLVLLCILSKGSTRVFTWPWVFYSQLLLLAPVLMAGGVLATRRRSAPAGGLAIVCCALAIGVSVASSNNPHFSFEAALYLWSGLAFTYWLAVSFSDALGNEKRFRTWARVAGFGLAAPVFSSIWQWSEMVGPSLRGAASLRDAFEILGTIRNQAPFGHPNYTGGYALLALPWFAALIRFEATRWRILWSLPAAGCLLMIFSSGSRGALLGSFALVACALLLAILTKQIGRKASVMLFLVGMVVVAIAGFSNSRVRGLLTDPAGLRYPNVGDVQRLGMLEGGWLLAKQRPLIGHGPGMVPFVFPLVRGELVGGVETSYQLHNAYLHQFVVTGALGAGAALLLLITIAQATLRWLRRAPGGPREIALSSVTALLGYGVMAVTDYQLDVIGIVAALGLYVGVLLAGPRESREDSTREFESSLPGGIVGINRDESPAVNAGTNALIFSKLAGALLLGGGIAANAVLIPHWQARYLHWSAWATIPDTNRQALLARLREAAEAAPWNVHYRNQLGLQQARDASKTDDPELRRVARETLQASLTRDAAQEPVDANLGWLWLRDDPVAARRHFQRALALIPDRDTVHLGLALSRFAASDRNGTVEELAMECLVNPPFVVSPFWLQPEFATLQVQVIARLSELIVKAAKHPAMPRWRQRDLLYFEAIVRWWAGGPAPSSHELAGADERQRAFFAVVTADPSVAPTWPKPWSELALPNDDSQHTDPKFEAVGNESARNGAIARWREGARDIAKLVRWQTPSNVGFLGTSIERSHYSLMHRNLDGPGYVDLAPRVADTFRQRYVEPLFPPRGSIPGPALSDFK